MTLTARSDSVLTDTTGLTPSNPLWTPATHPGVFFDLSCELGLTTDAGTITQAVDQISGYVMTPSEDSGAPHVEGAPMGGHTPIRLTGGHGLQTPDMGLRDAPFFAIAMRINAVSAADECVFFLNPSGAQSLTIFRTSSTLPGEPCLQYDGLGQIRSGEQSGEIVPSGYAIICAFWDADTARPRLRVNGIDYQTNSVAAPPVALPYHSGQIGRYGTPVLGMGDASLARLVLGEGAQPLLAMQKLEGFLAQRYTFANFLPVDAPYRSIAPRRLD